MAHCAPCKSQLKPGTGGLQTMMKKTSSNFRGTGRPMTSIAQAESGGRMGTGLSPSQWIPAASTTELELAVWARFTGGARALLHINGRTEVRRVLSSRNAGWTGLEVRLGKIVRRFGTGGCGKPKAGWGGTGCLGDVVPGTGCMEGVPSRLSTGAQPTHTQWSTDKGTSGPYASGHQGSIDLISVDYGQQSAAHQHGSYGSKYPPGTRGYRG